MGQSASVQIYNSTRRPIIYKLSQAAPLYWGIIQPLERKTIVTGKVHWTVEVAYYVSNDQLPSNLGSAIKVIGATAGFVLLPVVIAVPLAIGLANHKTSVGVSGHFADGRWITVSEDAQFNMTIAISTNEPPLHYTKTSRPAWLPRGPESNWALCGRRGVGKSTFINEMLEIPHGHPNRAPTGAVETTTVPSPYMYPPDSVVRIWDLPGAGTNTVSDNTEEYIVVSGLGHMRGILILCSAVPSDLELSIIKHLDRDQIPWILVRTKIDSDIESAAYDRNPPWTAEETIRNVKEEIVGRLRTVVPRADSSALAARVYAISARRRAGDWNKLKDDLSVSYR